VAGHVCRVLGTKVDDGFQTGGVAVILQHPDKAVVVLEPADV